ncbi:hypothetical protein ACJX0J_022892, partial [Zea mays]
SLMALLPVAEKEENNVSVKNVNAKFSEGINIENALQIANSLGMLLIEGSTAQPIKAQKKIMFAFV